MHKTIISDTGCFIILKNIEELDLLNHVYGDIVTTPEIVEEYGDVFPDWVKVLAPADRQKQQILELQIDKGESSAIALALELVDCTLILDDFKARKIAERLGLRITGTIGVIVRAKLNGIIPSVRPLLEKIKATDFRISAELEANALRAANE